MPVFVVGCDEMMDVVFLMDSSESMIENNPFGKPYYNWNLLKEFTKNIVQDLPVDTIKTRVAFVQYANQPKLVFDLNKYQNVSTIKQAIHDNVNHEGGITYTSEALRFTGNEVFKTDAGDRSQARDVVVIITDGLSNFDYMGTIPSAYDLRQIRPNVEIFTVAITEYVDETELKGIASSPADTHYLQLLDWKLMDSYVSTMVHRICNLPDPTPPVPTPPRT